MIKKGKTLQFYKWDHGGKQLQVVSQRDDGGAPDFSFYFNKQELENKNELMELFAKELYLYNIERANARKSNKV